MKKTSKKHSEVAQVGRFGLVGISNTLVDFILLNVLVVTILPKSLEILSINLFGVELVITGVVLAGIISGTAAMINSYIFNMRFTFRKKDVDTKHTVYFFLITIFGLYLIRPIVLKIFTDTWVWPADVAYYVTSSLKLPFSRDFDERNLALMVAILIVLAYNYLMYKKFVFTDEKNSTPNKIYSFISTNFAVIALVLIIVLAIVFRFYHLNSLPPGLHPDEAANGLDIFRILENHDIRVIYNTNGPRESLFFFFQAAFVKLLGNTILALRMAPALFGVLAIVFVYLYTKDWFGRRTALLASFMMAVNPWVVTISRDGFRASMVPLMIALVAFFAGRAYKTQKTWYFVGAAIAFGLGFYTYTAFFMFTLVVLGGLLYMLIARRKWLKSNIKNLIVSLGVFLIVIAPLGYTVVTKPGDSTARAGGTSFLNPSLNGGNPVLTLLESTGKTLLQYNYHGDENSRHNLPGLPLLNTFTSIMLLLGLLVCFANFKRVKYVAVLGMFFAMMLPSVLTAEGLPHALRSIGTAASVFTIAAVGINYLLVRWYKTFPVNALARNVGAITVMFLLFLSTVIGYRQYFVAWAQDPATYEAYSENMVQIGYYLNTNNSQHKFLIAGGYEAMPTEYITHSKTNYELLDIAKLQSQPLQADSAFYIYPSNDSAKSITEILQAKYPEGKLTPHYSSYNDKLLYYTFVVELTTKPN